jgi:hypothetical protein
MPSEATPSEAIAPSEPLFPHVDLAHVTPRDPLQVLGFASAEVELLARSGIHTVQQFADVPYEIFKEMSYAPV